METAIFKVYCGRNGKYYTFLNESKARDLYNKMLLSNYRTKLIKIENKREEILEEFNG